MSFPPDKITDGNISFKNTIRGCVVKFEVTAPQKMSFFEVFNEFLDKHLDWAPLSGHYKVLARLLRRFELYRQKTTRTKFTLILNDFDSTEIERFKEFVINEPKIYDKYPSIYKTASDVVETARKPRRPEKRGENSVIGILKRLRAFFNWCVRRGYLDRTPFATFTGIGSEKYGTPYYITIEERDLIADFDLSDKPALEVQRDIFVFQCLIGCRVSDLLEMTSESIINGAIEYIPVNTH